jgi:hypothetical protein
MIFEKMIGLIDVYAIDFTLMNFGFLKIDILLNRQSLLFSLFLDFNCVKNHDSKKYSVLISRGRPPHEWIFQQSLFFCRHLSLEGSLNHVSFDIHAGC